jgi:NAD(P)-dependent dehydrogenase (short-subunit alcohol dehydrogenase family)
VSGAAPAAPGGPQLEGQTVAVIGGSAGIGLATAKRARAEGAEVILAGRNPEHLAAAGEEVGARSTAAFDAEDDSALERFFAELDGPIDHVMVTAGAPYYGPLDELDFAKARRGLTGHPMLMLGVAKFARGRVRDGGALIFMGGTGARRPAVGLTVAAATTAALPALAANLALEVAPLRVNLIAAGFVDTPLSAAVLGDGLEARRQGLRETLPIGRVVGPDDVAALAIQLMANTALTGATYDIDGGQQFVPGG